ncbi:unnamed protein product [Rotaria sordida]|uniref:Uncharacterized protein n=1 Tax=Rotaria sordida TaxID=392033 RepID=A0A814REA1_9BILA|nr:unnamed protein product [Rotaria sordida]CAF1132821.1 unnamed protein product [Rotaria sordida]CAF1145333.1 unnamed protein product [Rotaria sordida]
MGFIKNVGPDGQTRQEQRIQDQMDNIHAGYLTLITYNNYWYNHYINNQTAQLNQQAVQLHNEQMDAARYIINQMLDIVEKN